MAYRLKKMKYLTKECQILMQNENGPCPLLAAVNCLLLRGTMELPSKCVKARVITIDELINVLAERVLINADKSSTTSNNTSQDNNNQQPSVLASMQSDVQQLFGMKVSVGVPEVVESLASTSLAEATPQEQQTHFAVQEVLEIFPSLQYGMDVNPKFTSGPSGVEYTKHLNAFDLLHVDLVHGWLIDPESEEALHRIVGKQTYNQLINQVIHGNEASAELEQMLLQQSHSIIGSSEWTEPNDALRLQQKKQKLTEMATNGSIIHNFLESSSHQLTQYGLERLYSRLKDDELVVFFRNNHFNTMTKHKGHLYLLVTDLGYAAVDVCWEKLDVIDGDTEFVTAVFEPPKPIAGSASTNTVVTGEDLLSRNAQANADMQLALQLSRETSSGQDQAPPLAAATNNNNDPQDEMEAALRASRRDYEEEQQRLYSPSYVPPQPTVVGDFSSLPSPGLASPKPLPVHASSMPKSPPPPAPATVAMGIPADFDLSDRHDLMMAKRLQDEEQASIQLALELQRQENERHQQQQQQQQQQPQQSGRQQQNQQQQRRQTKRQTASSGSSNENCTIM